MNVLWKYKSCGWSLNLVAVGHTFRAHLITWLYPLPLWELGHVCGSDDGEGLPDPFLRFTPLEGELWGEDGCPLPGLAIDSKHRDGV